MSASVQRFPELVTPPDLPLDRDRGTLGMWGLIGTEFALFVTLFCSYFFIGNNKNRWLIDQPPKFTMALILAAVLIASSIVLMWGEKQVKRENYVAGRIALGITILLGLGFLVLQSFEYIQDWKSLAPYSDSYGSMFYTITTFHAAHVVMGLLILMYVLILPYYKPAPETPYRPYHVAAMYWHFVDFVWLFIVSILYLIPNLVVYVIH